jgi:hypothetical protein
MKYPRYKFVVQVSITSTTGQGVRVASRCLWDPKKDNFATAVFKNVCFELSKILTFKVVSYMRSYDLWLFLRVKMYFLFYYL